MKILIAEDDPVTLIFMKKFLGKYGECDSAVNGLEAVAAFSVALTEEKPYDLVCLDIRMPKLDGIGVFKALKKIEKQTGIDREKEVKIIMTTAVNDREIITEASDAGCENYAWKPIEMERFILLMQNLGLIE